MGANIMEMITTGNDSTIEALYRIQKDVIPVTT